MAAADGTAAVGSRRGSTEEDRVQPAIPQPGVAGDESSRPGSARHSWQAAVPREQAAPQGRRGEHHAEPHLTQPESHAPQQGWQEQYAALEGGAEGQMLVQPQQPGSARAGAAFGAGDGGTGAADPGVQEVLAHWYYYRGQGYDAQAMAEWVRQVRVKLSEPSFAFTINRVLLSPAAWHVLLHHNSHATCAAVVQQLVLG